MRVCRAQSKCSRRCCVRGATGQRLYQAPLAYKYRRPVSFADRVVPLSHTMTTLSDSLHFALLQLHRLRLGFVGTTINCPAAHFALEGSDHSLQRHLPACMTAEGTIQACFGGDPQHSTPLRTRRSKAHFAHLQHLSRRQQRMAASQDAAVHWLAAASAPQPASAGWLPQTRWPAPSIQCV